MSVNGKLVGTVWKYPYRLDVTDYVKAGKNKIVAEVGNTWANRCLYDATLPGRQADNLGQRFVVPLSRRRQRAKRHLEFGADSVWNIRRNAYDIAFSDKKGWL